MYIAWHRYKLYINNHIWLRYRNGTTGTCYAMKLVFIYIHWHTNPLRLRNIEIFGRRLPLRYATK